MKLRTFRLLAIAAYVSCCLAGAGALAQNAYITDSGAVAVIATPTNTVTATIPVPFFAYGVAVTPDGSKVYVRSM